METINKNSEDFEDLNPFSMKSQARYDPALEARYSRLLACADHLKAEGIIDEAEWHATILSIREKLGLPIGIFNAD